MLNAEGHIDLVAPVVGGLAVLLLAGKLGGELATRVKQPAVLGELVAGIVLGNLWVGGIAPFQPIATIEAIEVMAGIGALILLFEVGVGSTVAQMMKVGATSLLVASLGVVVPFALGWGVGIWLLPDASPFVHAFLGATLTATSVGITARVLQDLGASRSPEARIILGAAVIDDVMGLVILGAVSGAIAAAAQGNPFSWTSIAGLTAAALGFLVGALVLGVTIAPRLYSLASLLQVRGVLVTVSLSICFLLAWTSNLIGLAPIVGAFAAGLILEDVHFKDFVGRGERSLEELLRPISDVLVPVFFVFMGLKTDLSVFAAPGTLGLAAALIVVAIIGKQACALGVGRGINRLAVGIGMIPRGEVGLIFANVGAGLTLNGAPVVAPSTFSAIVAMVVVTTLVTPPALKWSIMRTRGPENPSPLFVADLLSFVESPLWRYGGFATVERMTTNFRLTLVAFVLLGIAPLAGAQSHQHHSAPPAVSTAAAKQIQDVTLAASTLATPEAAREAGYEPVLGWIPMMGTHWVHGPRMLQGKAAVILTTPSQLMFSKVNGKDTLVGVAYAYYATSTDTARPVLFDGAPAWHDHPDLAPPGTTMQMLHTWFVDSPDGPFAGMNPFLPYWAAGVTPPAVARMHDPAFSARVRKGALALAETVEEAGLFPILARRPAVRPVLEERRAAIRALVPQLNTARTAADQAAWDALIDTLGTHFDAMREAYLASALDPSVRTRIGKALDDMIRGGH